MTRKNVITEAILGKEFARAESAAGRNVVSDWSPNNIKTIIFGWKKLYIEYHVCNKQTKKHGITSKTMVHTFTDKQAETWELKGSVLSVLEAPRLLSAVEEVYILDSSDYPRDILKKDLLDMQSFITNKRIKDRFPRLYAMGKINDTHENIKAVTDKGKNKHLHYAKMLKNVTIMYNNTNWWRYGNGSNAPLRPAFYAFDMYPDTPDGEIQTNMLLHRCFTEVAKPYWEKEALKSASDKKMSELRKAVTRCNEQYAHLDVYLAECIPAAAMADLLYQCNKMRHSFVGDARNHCLKIRAICNMVRDLYIFNRAGHPSNFKEWCEEHSSTSAVADDKLYDMYKSEFISNLKQISKILENPALFKNKPYGLFTDLLVLLKEELYPMLSAVLVPTDTEGTQLSVAVYRAARFNASGVMFAQYKELCCNGTLFKEPKDTIPDAEMVQYIYELCANFCYAVIYAELYSLHTEVNVRLDNPNAIVKNLLWNTNLYTNPQSTEPPVKYIYYDNRLMQIARAFATSIGKSDYKTLAEYIPNIGAIVFAEHNGETVCVPERVTRKYDRNIDVSLVQNGIHALSTLLQSVQYEQGLGRGATAKEQDLIQYVGKWHEMPTKQFSMLINNGIRMSKINE